MSEPEKREKLAENDPEQGLAAAFRQLLHPEVVDDQQVWSQVVCHHAILITHGADFLTKMVRRDVPL